MKQENLVKNGNEMAEIGDSQRSTVQNGIDKQELIGSPVSVEGTPFKIIEQYNDTVVIIGNNVVGFYESIDEARKAIEERDWNLILTSTMVMMEVINKHNEKNNGDNNTL